MSVKGALNVTAMMSILLTALMGFVTWSSAEWVKGRKDVESQHAASIADMRDRVKGLESDSAQRWRYMEQSITEIKDTLKELSKRR
jgi:hypothetical protein